MKKRKGQWLLITTLTFCIILSNIIILKSGAINQADATSSKKDLFENIKTQSSEALNSITIENSSDTYLEESLSIWSAYLKDYTEDHHTNITGYIIGGIPKGDSMNITIANFLGTTIDTLNITTDTTTTSLTDIKDGNTTTVYIASVPETFTFAYQLEYTTTDNQSTSYETSFATTRRMFTIIDLTLASGMEILRDCIIN